MPKQHIRDMKALNFYREVKEDFVKESSNTPNVRPLAAPFNLQTYVVKAVAGLF